MTGSEMENNEHICKLIAEILTEKKILQFWQKMIFTISKLLFVILVGFIQA